jgi:hypothetical protein
MITASSHRRSYRALTAALLVFGLLLSQWVGWTHAIAHSGIASTQAASDSSWEPIQHTHSASHCAALDAATLGASLHSSGLLVLPAVRASAAIDLPVRGGIARLTALHFNSRAPPHLA